MSRTALNIYGFIILYHINYPPIPILADYIIPREIYFVNIKI